MWDIQGKREGQTGFGSKRYGFPDLAPTTNHAASGGCEITIHSYKGIIGGATVEVLDIELLCPIPFKVWERANFQICRTFDLSMFLQTTIRPMKSKDGGIILVMHEDGV